jgi:zinc transport system substrate-binding protein
MFGGSWRSAQGVVAKGLRWGIALLAALGMAGCQRDKLPESAADKLVLASFHPMHVMALNVLQGVPGVRLENMTGPQTGCLHDYQLTPLDRKRIDDAWVFVVNGGGMERFLEKVVAADTSLRVVEASRGIELIRSEFLGSGHGRHEHGGQSHDHDRHDHGDEEFNPHVWVSVTGAIEQVRNLGEQFSALDTAHAALYRANAEAYIAKLDTLRRQMHQALDPYKGRKIITFHEAFPYFAREFGLEIAAVIEREPGSEPSASELAETVKIVREHGVKVLFAEPQYPAKAAQAVANETGTVVRILDPAVNGDADPDSYLRTMRGNLVVLREALENK